MNATKFVQIPTVSYKLHYSLAVFSHYQEVPGMRLPEWAAHRDWPPPGLREKTEELVGIHTNSQEIVGKHGF